MKEQLALDLDTPVVQAARRLGITRLTYFPRGCPSPRAMRPCPYWSSERADGSGPYLNDGEAAELIAAGIPWRVWDYEEYDRLRLSLGALWWDWNPGDDGMSWT